MCSNLSAIAWTILLNILLLSKMSKSINFASHSTRLPTYWRPKVKVSKYSKEDITLSKICREITVNLKPQAACALYWQVSCLNRHILYYLWVCYLYYSWHNIIQALLKRKTWTQGFKRKQSVYVQQKWGWVYDIQGDLNRVYGILRPQLSLSWILC